MKITDKPMLTQYTPCPSCGTIGEIGSHCEYCKTLITLREGNTATSSRIVKQRNITPQKYAEKISIYHNIEPLNEEILRVSIGEQYGIINLNGDIIYPLGKDYINLQAGHIITFPKTPRDRRYYNLDFRQYADDNGFIKDKEHPSRLYRVNINSNDWTPLNTYTNFEGEERRYDYAENILSDHKIERDLYIFHNGDKCSLFLYYSKKLDSNIKYPIAGNSYSKSHLNPSEPICVLEDIQDMYYIKEDGKTLHLILKSIDGKDITLKLRGEHDSIDCDWGGEVRLYKRNSGLWNYKQIYIKWCRAVGRQLQEPTPVPESDKDRERQIKIEKNIKAIRYERRILISLPTIIAIAELLLHGITFTFVISVLVALFLHLWFNGIFDPQLQQRIKDEGETFLKKIHILLKKPSPSPIHINIGYELIETEIKEYKFYKIKKYRENNIKKRLFLSIMLFFIFFAEEEAPHCDEVSDLTFRIMVTIIFIAFLLAFISTILHEHESW